MLEEGDGSQILPLVQQAVRGLTMPAVGVLQQSNQLRRASLTQPWRGPMLEFLRGEPVNPAPVRSAPQVELGADVVRDRPGVLNRLAVHVEDRQRTVGRIDKV